MQSLHTLVVIVAVTVVGIVTRIVITIVIRIVPSSDARSTFGPQAGLKADRHHRHTKRSKHLRSWPSKIQRVHCLLR